MKNKHAKTFFNLVKKIAELIYTNEIEKLVNSIIKIKK